MCMARKRQTLCTELALSLSKHFTNVRSLLPSQKMYIGRLSVQEALARPGAAQARDAFALVRLQRKLVVVRDLVADSQVALGKDDDLLLPVDREHLGRAARLRGVWARRSTAQAHANMRTRPTQIRGRGRATYLAAVVHEARNVAHLGRVDDLIVDAKQVRRADAALLVLALTLVRHLMCALKCVEPPAL